MNPVKLLIKQLRSPSPTQGVVVRVDGTSIVVVTSEGAVLGDRAGLEAFAEGDTVAVSGNSILGKVATPRSLPVFTV